MTNRRLFLCTSVLSLIGIASKIAKATPAVPRFSDASRHGYALTNGATALRRDDGSWIFWVRIINLDDPVGDIKASLQVATDNGFTQIVDVVPFTLSLSKSFIAQPTYSPMMRNTQLYYRYIVGSGPSIAPSVSSTVKSIAPWNTESTAE